MPLQPGTRAGHYEILAPLGAGGMAEVYRARDSRLGREVAFKVLPPAFAADDSRVERFEREARAISMLNHPNILAVYDVGTHEGLPFLVTELLQGETLHQRLRHGPLAVRKAMLFAQQIARGLAAAHDRGVTHRDLKPENLFITRDGIVKILDFGLAKLDPSTDEAKLLRGEPATVMGATVGTVGYMSPEQVRGEQADHRSDIFSFGTVLYEMLAGEPAFAAPTGAESLVKILREEPAPLPLPPAVQQVLQHCLEKQPDERFQSASDLGFALQAIASSDVSGTINIPRPKPRGLRFWLSRLATPAAAAVLVTLAAGALLGHFVLRGLLTVTPVYHQVTFRRGNVVAARFAKGGQTIVYSANWEGRPLEVFSVRPEFPGSRSASEPSTALAAVTPAGELGLLLRARYLHHLQWMGTLATAPLDGGAPRELLHDVEAADWDPTAPSRERVAVVRHDPATGNMRLEFPVGIVVYETPGWISHLRVAPDGKLLAFLDHPLPNDSMGSVAVVDSSGKKKTLSAGWAAEAGLAWSAKGDEVFFSATQAGSTLAIYGVTLDGRVREVLSGAGRLLLQDVSRQGALLVASETVRSALIAGIGGAGLERDLSWLDHSFRPHLSDDGSQILFTEGASAAGPHYSVCLRGTDGSPVVRLGEGTGLGLSPDGKWALAVVNTTPGELMLLPTGAGQPKTLPHGAIEAYGFGSFLPDGKQVLFVANEAGQPQRAYLQSVSGGGIPAPALQEGLLPAPDTISPDGKWVACKRERGPYMLCPLDGGQPRSLTGMEEGEEPFRWTPDGRALYVANLSKLPVDVYQLETATGQRRMWKQVSPSDMAGLANSSGMSITPDGRSFVNVFVRVLSELYTVDGVK